MTTAEQACALLARGNDYKTIANHLGISLQHAYRCTDGMKREPLKPTARTIVRRFPHNGGCSTTSGMIPVSLPRIAALHGVAA